jgi:hypothetical protein
MVFNNPEIFSKGGLINVTKYQTGYGTIWGLVKQRNDETGQTKRDRQKEVVNGVDKNITLVKRGN